MTTFTLTQSPVVALNRAAALAEIEGRAVALPLLKSWRPTSAWLTTSLTGRHGDIYLPGRDERPKR
jgi:predicted RNA polymerase sigma factor